MKPGIVLLFVVSVGAAFLAGWQVGRTHAPVVERPRPQEGAPSPHAAAPADRTTSASSPATASAPATTTPDAPKPAAPPPQAPDPTDGAALAKAIRKALAAGDQATAARLGEELKAWIGKDAARALQVFAEMDGITDAELLRGLFHFLRDNFLKDPQVRARMLETALTHADPAHRILALEFLRRAVENDPGFGDSVPQATVQQIVAMMRTSTDDGVKAQSAMLLDHFLDRQGVADAMREVALDFHETSQGAREAAIEALRTSHDPAAVGILFDVMKQDPNEGVRRKAAESLMILAPQGQKDEVVRQVDSLLGTEKSWEVKGMLVFSLVRVAPDDALPVLQRASAREGDPKARARLDVITGVLADGERDPFKIWMRSQDGLKRLEAQGK